MLWVLVMVRLGAYFVVMGMLPLLNACRLLYYY